MSDLTDIKAAIANLATDRGAAHAVVLAVAAAELLARDLDAELRSDAGALGRVLARHLDDPDLDGLLEAARKLGEVEPTPPVGVDVEPADLAAPLPERLAGALLRTEAGQAVLTFRAERAAQARAALAPAEAALVEARRLARALDSCRRRAADLERRFDVARETLTRAGAASRVAVDELLVEVLP